MKKTIRLVLIVTMLFLIIIPQLCFADQTLEIVFGDALQPWIIPETNEGILIDILKETLESSGHRIKPVYVPFARRLKMYEEGNVDAVCDINPKIIADSKLEGYMSVIAYSYENIGVSLKEKGYNVSKISDLINYEVVSWQGAKVMLGGEYADMANKNEKYREIANQKLQVKMLYAGRPIVIQLDNQIFKYYRKKISEEEEKKLDTNQPVDIFQIFGKNECGFFFRDKNIQVTFDKNFEILKESGQYDKIFIKYTQ